ncbi:MAG: dihydrolipoamide acetyltransferase family protein [Candidatus Promineifilaceae bacterium]|nr:dihydrolipoamide acetyltransferase family protein [Candidatus Promineifilaceae bacterium]
MADFIVMPKLGFDMREGVLVTWLKDVGDSVEKGEVVAEIESDKATLELEAQAGGTLLKLLADEGDVVPIGDNLAIVGEEGEDISGMESAAPAADQKEVEEEAESEAAPAEKQAEPSPNGKAAAVDEQYPGGVKATPVARRVASEHDVDLTKVSGSGPGGRIRKADVESYMEQREAAPQPTFEPTSVPSGPETTEVPTSRLRQAIGRRMVESKTTVPHFYVTTEVDMGPALALRKEINALLPDEQKVTVNDMIVKAAALALRDFPNINASFGGDKIVRHNRINVGSAVAVEGGLLTVVQKNTDRAPLAQIAVDNKTMIQRARDGKSRPEDFEGGTFTVSNLGAFDVEHFIAIINPPDAAILAVGTAMQVPVVVDGELAVGYRMKGTISADHRVTDGAEAAQFMQRFKAILEEPLQLLL